MIAHVVGIGGLKTSGKDAFARVLEANHYERRGMSDVLDELLIATDPWVAIDEGEPCWDHPSAILAYNQVAFLPYSMVRKNVEYDEAKKIRDVRRLLLGIGTEGGRTLIDPEVWVTGALRSAGKIAIGNIALGKDTVITGIRYPNELDMIHRLGGTAIWIDRPIITAAHNHMLEAHDPLAVHSSENTLTAADFDIVVLNDGSLDELKAKATSMFLDNDQP